VAHQIRNRVASAEKHFFDWLVIPIASVQDLIENRFSRFINRRFLVPTYDGDKIVQVLNKRYNVVLYHDFHNAEEFSGDNFSQVKNKYRYLGGKFLSLLNDDAPVCFIRRWHSIDGHAQDHESSYKLFKFLEMRAKGKVYFVYLHHDSGRPLRIDGCYMSRTYAGK
jgi:hypothetical protein